MKRLTAAIFTVILLFQACIPVSAAKRTVVQRTYGANYDKWMADTLLNGIDGTGGGWYQTFKQSQDPIYRTLGAAVLDNKPLLSISTAWSVFLNDEYRNRFYNEQEYIYEVILMDFLKYRANLDVDTAGLEGNTLKFTKKLYSTLAGELSNNTLNYIDNKLSVEEAARIWKKAKIADNIEKIIEKVDNIQKPVKAIIEGVADCLALEERKTSVITLLRESGKAAEKNKDYKIAVREIVTTLNSTELTYMSKKTLGYLWIQNLDDAWELLTDANPWLGGIELYAAGLDVLFNTSNSASNNLKLALLYTMDCYMSIALTDAASEYRSNKTPANARKFRECFEAYVEFQMFGNEYAKQWLDEYLDGESISNAVRKILNKKNIKTAQELLKLCNSQTNSRKKILKGINTYTDIYEKKYPITKTEIIPDPTIKLSATSVSIQKGKTYTLKATVTGASRKVTWKSSNSSVASVSSTGKVTAKAAGKAVISASANGKTAKCTVTVVNNNSYDLSQYLNLTIDQVGRKLKLHKIDPIDMIMPEGMIIYQEYNDGVWHEDNLLIYTTKNLKNKPGAWKACIDGKYSFYGIKEGISSDRAKQILSQKGYRLKKRSGDGRVWDYLYIRNGIEISLSFVNNKCSSIIYYSNLSYGY